MKPLLFLLVFAVAWPSGAKTRVNHKQTPQKTAAEKSPRAKGSTEKILSFYQWSALSEKNRAAYIQGLRYIHLNLENERVLRGIQVGGTESRGKEFSPVVRTLLMGLGTPAFASGITDGPECQHQAFIRHRDGRMCTYYDRWYNIGQWTYCTDNDADRFRLYASNCPGRFLDFINRTAEGIQDPAARAAFRREVTQYQTRTPPEAPPEPSPEQPQPPDEERARPAEAPPERCPSRHVTCEMMSHSARSLDDYRQAYRAAMNERRQNGGRAYCAVGGMVSELSYPRQMCTPVTRLTIGTWNGTCRSGQTLCNPMIFGFQDDGKPFCAPLAQYVTSECWSMARRAGNTDEKIARQLMGQTPATENIGLDSLAETWAEFRRRMTSLCEPGPSLEFHCNECNAMSMQIASMNLSSTCADRCGRVDPHLSDEACRTSYRSRATGGGEERAPAEGTR